MIAGMILLIICLETYFQRIKHNGKITNIFVSSNYVLFPLFLFIKYNQYL